MLPPPACLSKASAVAVQTLPGPRQEMPSAVALGGPGKAGHFLLLISQPGREWEKAPSRAPPGGQVGIQAQGMRATRRARSPPPPCRQQAACEQSPLATGPGRPPHLESAGGPLGGGVEGPHQEALLQPLEQRLPQVVLEPDRVHAGVVVADVALDGRGGGALPLVERPDGLGHHGQRGRVAALGGAGWPRGLCGGREREPAGGGGERTPAPMGLSGGGRAPLAQQPLTCRSRHRARPTLSAGGAAPGPALLGGGGGGRRPRLPCRPAGDWPAGGLQVAARDPLTSARPTCPPTGEAFGQILARTARGVGWGAQGSKQPRTPPTGNGAGSGAPVVGPRPGGRRQRPLDPSVLGGGGGWRGLLRGSLRFLPFAPQGASEPGASLPCFGTPLSPRSPAQKGRKTLARAAPGGSGCQPGSPTVRPCF